MWARAAAQIEIGQTVASAASAAVGGTAAANAATAPVSSGAVHGSVKAPVVRNSKRRKRNRHDRPSVPDAAPAVGAQLNALRRLRFRPSSLRPPMTSPSPSQASASYAANNQTKAPVVELGQKFWAGRRATLPTHRCGGEPLGSFRVDAAQYSARRQFVAWIPGLGGDSASRGRGIASRQDRGREELANQHVDPERSGARNGRRACAEGKRRTSIGVRFGELVAETAKRRRRERCEMRRLRRFNRRA